MAVPCIALVSFCQHAAAVDATWNAQAGNWVTGANWTGGTAPGALSTGTNADTATFGSSISAARIITVDSNRNIKNIFFDNFTQQYTLSGGSLLLTNGGTVGLFNAPATAVKAQISTAITIMGDGSSYTFLSNGNPTNSRGLVIAGNVSGASTGSNVTTLNLTGTSVVGTAAQGNSLIGFVSDGTGGGKLAINKTGAGTWVLSGSNAYSGGTTLNGGILRLIDVTANAGNVNIAQNGLGVGAVTLTSGTLQLQVNGANDASAQTLTLGNNVVVNGPSTIRVESSTGAGTNKTLALGNLSIGAQTLNVIGADGYSLSIGTATLSGAATFNPTTAALTLAGLTVDNSVGASTTTTATLGGTSANGVVSGLISNNSGDASKQLGLIKSGTGTWSLLSGSNSYTGGTAINGGILNVVNGALGSSGAISFGGGTLQYASGNSQDISSRIANSTGTIAIDTNGNNVTYAGNIGNSNSGGLTKTGSGILTLSGSNSFTGSTSILGGAISVGNNNWSGTGTPLYINSGTFQTTANVTFNTSAPNPHPVTIGAGGATFDTVAGMLNIASPISGAGSLTKVGSGTMQVGSASFTGALNLNGGAFQVVLANRFSAASSVNFDGGALNLINSGQVAQTSTNSIVLNAGGGTINALATSATNTWTFSGPITGTGALTTNGPNTIILTGSNTYSGGTTVNTGTLLINGSNSSAVVVNSTAVLGGNGSIAAAVTVNSGGILAPGNSPGILSTGNLSLAGSLSVELGKAISGSQPVAGTDYDQVNVTGSVTLTGGDLTLSILSGMEEGDLYFIVANDLSDAVTGIFATLNGVSTTLTQGSTFSSGGRSFEISYVADYAGGTFTGGNDVALLVVPEPSTWALLGLGFGALVFRARSRRRNA